MMGNGAVPLCVVPVTLRAQSKEKFKQDVLRRRDARFAKLTQYFRGKMFAAASKLRQITNHTC